MTDRTPHVEAVSVQVDNPGDSLTVHVGTREIFETLITIREDVKSIREGTTVIQKDIDDHETRIRSLERWKYGIPVTAIGTIAGVILSVWK